MNITKVQLSTLIYNHINTTNGGLNEVMEMLLNAIMKAERSEELTSQPSNKANGYRVGKVYGQGKLLELRIPRDRNGQFYPKILALLRSQQAETDRLVSALYGKGLTQSEVGEVFEDLYGRHYSSSSIGRMIEWMREDVAGWLDRDLEPYYPIIYIDALHVKVRRKSVDQEAFYVILAVTPEGRREVIAIDSLPTESATGWEMLFRALKKRGLKNVGLVVADGLTGIDRAIACQWPQAGHQQCVTHIKRRLLARVRTEDREDLADDLREVFYTEHLEDSSEAGWKRWNAMAERWKGRYRSLGKLKDHPDYRNGFTYLDFDQSVRSMIYTTNWIERLNRDFRRVLRMRGAMPDESSVITLMGYVAQNKKAYDRKLPRITTEKRLFKTINSHSARPGGMAIDPNDKL